MEAYMSNSAGIKDLMFASQLARIFHPIRSWPGPNDKPGPDKWPSSELVVLTVFEKFFMERDTGFNFASRKRRKAQTECAGGDLTSDPSASSGGSSRLSVMPVIRQHDLALIRIPCRVTLR